MTVSVSAIGLSWMYKKLQVYLNEGRGCAPHRQGRGKQQKKCSLHFRYILTKSRWMCRGVSVLFCALESNNHKTIRKCFISLIQCFILGDTAPSPSFTLYIQLNSVMKHQVNGFRCEPISFYKKQLLW